MHLVTPQAHSTDTPVSPGEFFPSGAPFGEFSPSGGRFAELLLDRVRPVGTSTESRWPVYKTMFYTFDISARFLANAAIGRGTIACCDQLLDTFWRRVFASGNGRVLRSGFHHFAPGRSHVVMTNHMSLLDIPALMATVPSVRMVFKEELSRIPVWGNACKAAGFVPIDRKNREKAIQQLEVAKKVLAQGGVNMWISPEGTRARDGQLAAFKKGGFHLALDLGLPIVPGWIEGADSIIKPDQFVVVPDGEVHVHFGKPIPTANLRREDLPELMDKVRTAIVGLSGRPDPLAQKRAA